LNGSAQPVTGMSPFSFALASAPSEAPTNLESPSENDKEVEQQRLLLALRSV
jgi:hypothetical protein